MDSERILRDLAAFASDEEASVKRVRRTGWLSKASGWLLLFLCFSIAFMYPRALPAGLLILIAGMGGVLLALGVWFTSTADTWPVLRGYLDLDRLRAENDAFASRAAKNGN